MKTKGPVLLALACLAILPYLPGAWHGFVYDDHGAIVENRFLADASNIRRVLTLDTVRDPGVLDGQRPVLLLTMFLDRFGSAAPQPWRHHATNLFLHAAAVLLLFGLARRLAGGGEKANAFAGVAALVLAMHPAWSEAVQVPSYREDLLGLVFVLGYLLADFIPRAALRRPVQLAALFLALASKESAWAAPLLLGWMRFCVPAPGRSPREGAAAVMVGLLLVGGTVAAGYVGRPWQAAGAAWNGLSLRWPENLWTAPWLWLRGLGLMMVPFPLVADRVVNPVAAWWDTRCWVGLLAGAALLAAAWRGRTRAPLLALGAGWLILAFGPVSNVVPLFNPMAERYLYGLAPGFALVAADLLLRRRHGTRLLAALAAVWLLLLQLRLGDWRDDAALWTATARAEPRSARAQTWLGLLAKQTGGRAEARAFFEKAESLNPRDVSASINLSILDGEEGDLAGAERRLRDAVARRPDKAEGWANLAVALELQGRREEALQASEKARALFTATAERANDSLPVSR